ncbi:MAG TPA: tetratricopeptide repeat protein [Bacteroidales bacterium]|nr:tetratricopeptide repeat protein [Bacteroidales bacterium]
MKKNIFPIAVLLLLVVMIACQNSRREAIDQITKTEESVFDESGIIDQARINELIDVYISYAESYPQDSLAPGYLFRAADVAMTTNRSNQAIILYQRIREEYPDYRKVPEAFFLEGYVYENYLGRLDKAKAIYEEFLEKYPDNDFAKDAEISLKYLGKSPEELIEIFQQTQQDTLVDNK